MTAAGVGARNERERIDSWLGVGIREGSQRRSCLNQLLKEHKSCAAGEKGELFQAMADAQTKTREV